MTDERATTGCWTCRLRKKKCDEARPNCARCESHNLDCHGYGRKPEWMDKGDREKAELAKVKAVVKNSANAKRAEKSTLLKIHKKDTKSDSPTSWHSDLANDALIASCSTPAESATSIFSIQHPDRVEEFQQVLAELRIAGSRVLSDGVREREASLLMHYFDVVFPLQYRFYSPSETETDRGWLLSLLSQTKPLYHAALSLSALHLQVLQKIKDEESHVFRVDQVAELYEHHDLALKELQQFIQVASDSDDIRQKVQILACIVQFISFEIFLGGTHNWEFHLQAGAVLVPDLIDHIDTTVHMDTTAVAITFLSGVILWLDVLSTITTGKRPLLWDSYEKILSVIPMDKTVACRNWVVAIIAEISALAQRKAAGNLGEQEMWNIDNQAQHLMQRIQRGMLETTKEGDLLKERNAVRTAPEFSRYVSCVSTRVYAAAALVYLQSSVYGYDGPDLRPYVSQTIAALDQIPEPQMVRSFTWPLTVAGCMAIEAEQPFFENKLMAGGKAGMAFGNSSQTLTVLRKCWELRKGGANLAHIDWKRAQEELHVRVLHV